MNRKQVTELVARVHNTYILSYNVKMMPFDSTSTHRAKRIVRHLQQYDIVCLQELFDNSIREQIEDAVGKQYNLRQRNDGPPSDLFKGHWASGGIAILTRFPMVRSSYREFAYLTESGFDSLANKGVAHSLLRVSESQYLHVFVAHTQSGYTAECRRGRFTQCKQIAEFVRECTEDDEHEAVLVGDLNVDARRDADYEFLVNTMNHELLPQRYMIDIGAQQRTTRATFEEGTKHENIDYAFAIVQRGQVAHTYKSSVKKWKYSDHYALHVQRQER